MWIVLFASNQNNLRENIGLASFAQKIGKGGGLGYQLDIDKTHVTAIRANLIPI